MPRTDALAIGGVAVSHGDRVVDAAGDNRPATTKADLVRYYDAVAPLLLAQLRGRPVALLRAPGGVGGSTFFQKHPGKPALPGVRVLDPALWPGRDALFEIGTRRALLSAAQMNAIEFHAWHSRSRRLYCPDRMVFDLDPGAGVEWPAVREGARLVRDELAELGLESWVKTSGGKGLHVVVPIAPRWRFEVVKACSKAVVERLAGADPERFVAKSGPANRPGRIFVDYLRNGEGATTVAAYSARARPGLGVAMPLEWDELDAISGAAHWTATNAAAHIAARGADPWAGMAQARQTLTRLMKSLGLVPPAASAPGAAEVADRV